MTLADHDVVDELVQRNAALTAKIAHYRGKLVNATSLQMSNFSGTLITLRRFCEVAERLQEDGNISGAEFCMKEAADDYQTMVAQIANRYFGLGRPR